MFTEHNYPILEFDDNKDAVINPVDQTDTRFSTDKMVITFGSSCKCVGRKT